MDKKKLIGTIVGVTMFAALIAGATFAWLTFNVTVAANTSTSGKSMNFTVDYVGGSQITSLPILATATPTTATSKTTVKANKASGSAPGTLYIYVNTETTSDEALLTSQAINYALCVGTCTTFTESSTVKVGKITATGKKEIYSGELTSTATNYTVYFWLDGNLVDNSLIGKSYSGFISAEAKQVGYQ